MKSLKWLYSFFCWKYALQWYFSSYMVQLSQDKVLNRSLLLCNRSDMVSFFIIISRWSISFIRPTLNHYHGLRLSFIRDWNTSYSFLSSLIVFNTKIIFSGGHLQPWLVVVNRSFEFLQNVYESFLYYLTIENSNWIIIDILLLWFNKKSLLYDIKKINFESFVIPENRKMKKTTY